MGAPDATMEVGAIRGTRWALGMRATRCAQTARAGGVSGGRSALCECTRTVFCGVLLTQRLR